MVFAAKSIVGLFEWGSSSKMRGIATRRLANTSAFSRAREGQPTCLDGQSVCIAFSNTTAAGLVLERRKSNNSLNSENISKTPPHTHTHTPVLYCSHHSIYFLHNSRPFMLQIHASLDRNKIRGPPIDGKRDKNVQSLPNKRVLYKIYLGDKTLYWYSRQTAKHIFC